MKENELPNGIANLYAKFFDVEKNSDPTCQCGYTIKTKQLRMDLKLIYYGICDNCKQINYFKVFNEFNKGTYRQIWQRIDMQTMKSELENFLGIEVQEEVIKVYTHRFDEIIVQIQQKETEKTLTKVKFQKNK